MRLVAVVAILATLVAASPLALGAPPDDCVSRGTSQVCQTVDLTNAHNGAPVLNTLAYFDVFYVWVGPGSCSNPVASVCNGAPSGSDGITLPDGSGTVPVPGVFSVLYQETNGAAGLQRLQVQTLRPDRTVLV